MSMKAVVTNIDHTKNKIVVDGTITLSGSYVAHGDALDLSGLGVPSNSVPTKVSAWSEVTQGSAILLDYYQYVPGTKQSNGLLQVSVSGSEMAATAYATTTPTNATGYVLQFQAEFPAFL